MNFKLIGLSGSAGAGKDTIADILCNKFGFQKIGLADPIKDGVEAMFGIPREHLYDRTLKEQPSPYLCGRTPRYVMQVVGTEFGRNLIAEDIWTRIAYNRIKNCKEQGSPGVVITDIRFENEAVWFRKQSKHLWHITRKNNPFQIASNHISEKGIVRLDEEVLIENNKDLPHLENLITNLAFCK